MWTISNYYEIPLHKILANLTRNCFQFLIVRYAITGSPGSLPRFVSCITLSSIFSIPLNSVT